MKVYVSELPKSCGDCVFCKQTEYYYYCDKLHTKLGYFDKEKDCPLQSLDEHDKQVRKEVCDSFRKTAMQYYKECDRGSLMLSVTDVWEILDQIQGE